mgnify:CR=1 FL=1
MVGTVIWDRVTNHQCLNTSASNIDGLRGEYTVKVDANGHVAGFGLANTYDNVTDSATSEFYVNADRFAILPNVATSVTPLWSASTTYTEGNQVKHVGFSQMGDPATVLEVKTEASRALRPGEVRVKVLASPINPSDLLQIAGNYGVDPVLPARPGSEGIGRVTEVSADVQALTVGQLVLLASGNTWAEELVAPTRSNSWPWQRSTR